MTNSLLKILILVLTANLALTVRATVPEAEPDAVDDTDTRLNPDMGISVDPVIATGSRHYPYIKYSHNAIEMNGDSWEDLGRRLHSSATEGTFTIVHIGDSHIQADGNTGTTRNLFQDAYGDAGRGIIVPFKLAGTNNPLDYTISSSSNFVKSKLMKLPWATKMGFTGVSLQPTTYRFDLRIKTRDPYAYFTILGDGDFTIVDVSSAGRSIEYVAEHTERGIEVVMDTDENDVIITMEGRDVTLYGIDIRKDRNGVIYHAIGNNGAAYSSYMGIDGFGRGVAALEPDLVILSLGTNEAFGRLNDATFNAQLSSIVSRIRRESPDAKILLTTPSECQKSVYTSTRRRKGRRRRRVRSYQINENIARVRNLIIEYGRKNNIPVYDFYDVAGGAGASTKWLNDKLLSTDRIHRTWAGYRLDGELIYDALIKALDPQRNKTNVSHPKR